jgi:tetratricopeptide (TPR) repeat protein
LVLAELGEASAALNRVREGEQLTERSIGLGYVGPVGWFYRHLGHACLRLGRLDDARRFIERAITFCAPHPGYAAAAERVLGDIAIHPGVLDDETGEIHYRKALALAEPRGMRPLVAHCHLGLGKLYHRTDKREQAREHLATATAMYREMGMTYWLEKAETESRSRCDGLPS